MRTCPVTTVLLFLLWMFLAVAPAMAQQTAAAPGNPLEPMKRFIGNWRGQIRLLDGTVIEARNIFEWSLDGKTIVFRAYGITKEGEQHVYDGLYGWDPQGKRIVFREQSAYGALIDGTVEPEGEALVFTWTQRGARGVVEYRETFRFPDPDTYAGEAYKKSESGWERFTLENRFVRDKEAATAAVAGNASWQRSLRKQVTVAAPLADVWKAWTTTEGVTGFFGPAAKVEARIGGPYEIYFGPSQPEGQRGSEGCKVHSVVPMKLLAFEWNAPPTIPVIRNSGVHTLVYIELEEAGPGQTRVTMTHTGWGVGEDWDKTFAYFDRAWEAVLSNLQYRFEVGRVEWPGQFIRAERQAKP